MGINDLGPCHHPYVLMGAGIGYKRFEIVIALIDLNIETGAKLTSLVSGQVLL